jgi:hypothetical protein
MSKKLNLDWQPITEDMLPQNATYVHPFVPNMTSEFKFRDVVYKHVYVRRLHRVDGKLTDLVAPHVEMYRLGAGWLQVSVKEFLAECLIRPDPFDGARYNAWIDDLKPGDFVRCKGQRNPKLWKKVIMIKEHSIVSIQYTQPVDDDKYCQGSASENYIWFVREKHS